MINVKKPLFSLGRTLATPDTLAALERTGQNASYFLARHVTGDWGDLDAEDKQANDDAVKNGDRILSAYVLRDNTKIWVITEAEGEDGNRAATTVLLPENY